MGKIDQGLSMGADEPGLAVTRRGYDQTAIVCAVRHEKIHLEMEGDSRANLSGALIVNSFSGGLSPSFFASGVPE